MQPWISGTHMYLCATARWDVVALDQHDYTQRSVRALTAAQGAGPGQFKGN